MDASPARNSHPQDAPHWAYKADATVTTEGHNEESHDHGGTGEEPHAEESAGASQTAQLSQHCTPSGAGACTDSRRRISFDLDTLVGFLSSESESESEGNTESSA